MITTNHTIRPQYDLDLAMIEGTEVQSFCGERFVPTVTPGTSGLASVPGAPHCERCAELVDLCLRWSRLKDERNRINREMRKLAKQHKERFWDIGRSRELEQVTA